MPGDADGALQNATEAVHPGAKILNCTVHFVRAAERRKLTKVKRKAFVNDITNWTNITLNSKGVQEKARELLMERLPAKYVSDSGSDEDEDEDDSSDQGRGARSGKQQNVVQWVTLNYSGRKKGGVTLGLGGNGVADTNNALEGGNLGLKAIALDWKMCVESPDWPCTKQ